MLNKEYKEDSVVAKKKEKLTGVGIQAKEANEKKRGEKEP